MPMNLMRAKQEMMERDQARSQRREVQRRLADLSWQLTVWHEGGHSAIDTHFGHHVLRVSCSPDSGDRRAGECHFLTGGAKPFNLAVSALAGSIAEYLAGLTARIKYDAGDMDTALKKVSVSRIPAAESEAIRLLSQYWGAVRAISTELVKHGELTGGDVRLLMRKHSNWRERTA